MDVSFTDVLCLKGEQSMKKIISVLLVALCLCGVSQAENVSQKQARELAQLFFNESAGRVTAPPKMVYNGRRLTTNRLFVPFYVFNTSLGGFVIISAENKAYPILGFSLRESFDPDRLGDTELALLKSYATEIEFVRYDTEPVDGAVWAWQNYGEYVSGILKAPYVATDPKISVEESLKIIDGAVDRDDAVYADIYTPAQWRDMILDELALRESAPVAFVDNNKVFPAVVYGRQGDYFRIEMTQRNSWLMRLNATEVIPSNMVSVVVNPLLIPFELEEERPFADYDDFMEEVMATEEARMTAASIDIPMFDGTPMVRANGGGRFEVQLPEEAVMARVYNLAGSMVKRHTYSGLSTVNIDISEEPSGFYFVTIAGESGTPYGLKLFR